MTIAPEAPAQLRFLSLEITARCQLTCPSHCYAQAGPTRSHGTMAEDDWRRTIDEAAAMGTETVQFIGGEPTLHPAFVRLVEHALDSGLRVWVYSNLYRLRAEHWKLFEHPRVSLATSYYSDDAGEHDAVTGRRGSHGATRQNIREAVRRGVRVKVGIVDLDGGPSAERARAELEVLGVHEVHVGQVRTVGNAAGTVLPTVSSLCGQCAKGKAAVLPTGQVARCEIGRFLTVGSVKHTPLASVLASDRWAEVAASIPRRLNMDPCNPDCPPNQDTACPPEQRPVDDE